MRIEYIKDAEPHFVGTVVDVDTETAERLIEAKVAKEVDSKTDLRNVAAEVSQDGMSLDDKRKRGLAPAGFEGKTSKKGKEGEESDKAPEGDKYDDMKGDDLKAELEKRELPKSGSVDELRARLREDDAAKA